MDCDIGEVSSDSFVRPYVPQSQILRRASAAVLSGNATAALGALTAGVPTLLIPAGGEQPDVAEACVNAGSARLLTPESMTVERLRNELSFLLQDVQIRRTTRQLAEAFSRVNSAQVAADLLERLVTGTGKGQAS
jgi:UDP:flavonoid glycosyltransferase YjiC (YdhE family)